MASKPKTYRDPASLGVNTILGGASVKTLSLIFRKDVNNIRAKIGGVKPCGERHNAPIYQIRDVAPLLVQPAGDIEDYIRSMRHNDLPPLLSKEYWNGQRAKQRALEEEGKLWQTDKVEEAFGALAKLIRQNLLLMVDRVDRESSLSEPQRMILRRVTDEALESMRLTVIETFNKDFQYAPGTNSSFRPEDQGEAPEVSAALPDYSSADDDAGDDDDDFFDLPDIYADDSGL